MWCGIYCSTFIQTKLPRAVPSIGINPPHKHKKALHSARSLAATVEELLPFESHLSRILLPAAYNLSYISPRRSAPGSSPVMWVMRKCVLTFRRSLMLRTPCHTPGACSHSSCIGFCSPCFGLTWIAWTWRSRFRLMARRDTAKLGRCFCGGDRRLRRDAGIGTKRSHPTRPQPHNLPHKY